MTSSCIYSYGVCSASMEHIRIYLSERVYRCTTDVEKWCVCVMEVYDSVFAYLMNGWMTKVGVGVASYGSVDEWIILVV